MAGISVGTSNGRRRSVVHDIPLIPFIDFLLCLIAFLLVTAVWTQMARIQADARVPGTQTPAPSARTMTLHVDARPNQRVVLAWKEGDSVLDTVDVSYSSQEELRERLGAEIERQWQLRGAHKAIGDLRQDRAVLHTRNDIPFAEVVGLMDAVRKPHRAYALGHEPEHRPAFAISFATD